MITYLVLDIIYYEGKGVLQKFMKAKEYFELKSKKGVEINYFQAMNYLELYIKLNNSIKVPPQLRKYFLNKLIEILNEFSQF